MIKNLKNLFSKYNYLVFFIVILLDQLSKYWAQSQNLVVINPGISFSLFSDLNISKFLLIFILILVYLLKKFSELSFLSIIFVAAAFSNILDRIFFSGVRDWLPVPILGLKNNLADWLMFLVVIFYFKNSFKKNEYKNNI